MRLCHKRRSRAIVLSLRIRKDTILGERRHMLGFVRGAGSPGVSPALTTTKGLPAFAHHTEGTAMLEVILRLGQAGNMTRALFRAQDTKVCR
jgi:hypothetical protein